MAARSKPRTKDAACRCCGFGGKLQSWTDGAGLDRLSCAECRAAEDPAGADDTAVRMAWIPDLGQDAVSLSCRTVAAAAAGKFAAPSPLAEPAPSAPSPKSGPGPVDVASAVDDDHPIRFDPEPFDFGPEPFDLSPPPGGNGAKERFLSEARLTLVTGVFSKSSVGIVDAPAEVSDEIEVILEALASMSATLTGRRGESTEGHPGAETGFRDRLAGCVEAALISGEFDVGARDHVRAGTDVGERVDRILGLAAEIGASRKGFDVLDPKTGVEADKAAGERAQKADEAREAGMRDRMKGLLDGVEKAREILGTSTPSEVARILETLDGEARDALATGLRAVRVRYDPDEVDAFVLGRDTLPMEV